jgi:glycosyltransferase involved in cell wall biosynthesis
LISEVIISDENGNDARKISEKFKDNPKLKIFTNEKRLGAFLNKITACKYATNEWIALIDSDNYADEKYFKFAYQNIINNHFEKETIIATHNQHYDYKKCDLKANKKNIKQLTEEKKFNSRMSNNGNYIINKYLISNLNIEQEIQENSYLFETAYDVLYFLILVLEQFNDLNILFFKDLTYYHAPGHSGSLVIRQANTNKEYFHKARKILNNRLNELLDKNSGSP